MSQRGTDGEVSRAVTSVSGQVEAEPGRTLRSARHWSRGTTQTGAPWRKRVISCWETIKEEDDAFTFFFFSWSFSLPRGTDGMVLFIRIIAPVHSGSLSEAVPAAASSGVCPPSAAAHSASSPVSSELQRSFI